MKRSSFVNRKWTSLPSLSNARWYHECSRITRAAQDYIVVVGGQGPSSNILVVEYYNLQTKPTSWETTAGIASK